MLKLRITGTKSSKDNLCIYCDREFATCSKQYIRFGDGTGLDNVIECSGFSSREGHDTLALQGVWVEDKDLLRDMS
jgi:hypothetical protein